MEARVVLNEELFIVKRNQIDMIADRGYDVSSELQKFLTFPDAASFVAGYTNHARQNPKRYPHVRHSLSMIYFHRENPQRAIYVYYAGPEPGSGQVKITVVRNCVYEIESIANLYSTKKGIEITDALFISPIPISQKNENQLRQSLTAKRRIQVFYDIELMYNPTKHVLTPEHRLLTVEETEEIIRQAKSPLSAFQEIRENDPIIRYYGWLPGRMVLITRNSYLVDSIATVTKNYRVITRASTGRK